MENGEHLVVLIYVDDILVMGKQHEHRHWVKRILEEEYEKITMDEGDRLPYLGMTIVKRNDGYEISMKSYIQDVLQLYGKEVTTCVTPAKANLFTVTEKQPTIDRVAFHSIVAKLLYLGKRGRPDILLPIQHEDGKGQSGCMVFLGNTLVHEACRKQKIVMRDSTEAEIVGLSDYLEEGELVEELLMDLGKLVDEDIIDTPQVIFQDNKPTISIVETNGGKPRTKYMRVRIAYVTERLCTGEVTLRYIHTSKMIADLLTKPLQGESFYRFAQTALGKLYAMSNRGAKGTRDQAGPEDSLVRAMQELNCSQPQRKKCNKKQKEQREHTSGVLK
jgi:hypothetical protein